MTDWHDIWPESIDPETGEDAEGYVPEDEDVATRESHTHTNRSIAKGR